MKLSVIVPVLNEGATIRAHLAALAPLRARGAEVIVADGGSDDATIREAGEGADHVIAAPRGRASQMNAGARVAAGDVFLFLHADTRLPAEADLAVARAVAGGHAWGRFDVRIDGRHVLLPVVAALMNARSRLTGIATGDQAIFVTRRAFEAVGGYADIPLMEDIVLSRALRRLSPPACLEDCVTTSGRRWERHGPVRTILAMWRLRLAFFFGADPRALALAYGYRPRDD
ncbi:MAG TPA: TIGR04283 family arsenosugar biosynthesis glycosyltransferase [Beijerinckiaceae bacterium]|nr:TIGR04283 family arsenosugar biosynthesis glycosyltransferase [Beijerinckiaceae bacterium]